MGTFDFHGWEIAYRDFGGGPAALTPSGKRGRTARSSPARGRTLVMAHGVLLSQRMDWPLAEFLAARGNRVITIDFLGHGESGRPQDLTLCTIGSCSRQLESLLDHLEIAQAAIMGTSMGANAALELAYRAPERIRGLVIEMPVLENALLAAALAFTPLVIAYRFAAPAVSALARARRLLPRRLAPHYANLLLDSIPEDPAAAAAVLQGLFYGRLGPDREVRRRLQTPALILGHRRDPIHAFSDAGMLAAEMPNARLVEASSVLELRLRPERLSGEISAFLDEIWGSARPSTRARGIRTAGA
jgi:pimeloyl-ACP methyl ester carboxylesterase